MATFSLQQMTSSFLKKIASWLLAKYYFHGALADVQSRDARKQLIVSQARPHQILRKQLFSREQSRAN
jgi:hypothetical protein